MEQRTLKKELKLKCKKEKAACWLYSTIGTALVFIALVGVVILSLLDSNGVFVYPVQIIGYIIMIIISLFGLTLDIIGEVQFRRLFKDYQQQKK